MAESPAVILALKDAARSLRLASDHFVRANLHAHSSELRAGLGVLAEQADAVARDLEAIIPSLGVRH